MLRVVVRRRAMVVFIAAWTAILIMASELAAASFQFRSTDGGYSIAFPAAPQEQVTKDENSRSVLNTLNHDNGYFAVVHVEHGFDLKPDDELDGNIEKFTKQMGAPAQLRRKMKFAKSAGEKLPAEEFTFESEEIIGKGIVIVEGRRTYMVVAFAGKPHDRKSAVDRFVASFKFAMPGLRKKDNTDKIAKDKAK
jgi:hypothetical protein